MNTVECLFLRNLSKNCPDWALDGRTLETAEVGALRNIVTCTLNTMVGQRLIRNFQIRLIDSDGVHIMVQDVFAHGLFHEFAYPLDSLRELCVTAEVMLS